MTEPVVDQESNLHMTDASNIPIEIDSQPFVDLIKRSFENEDVKKKISITLSSELISVLNNIITASPNTIIDIEKVIIEIIKDGKIDTNDIPNLIVVIQRMYQSIYSLKGMKLDTKKRATITGELLKFFIHLLVLERKIKIDEEPDKIYQFYTRVDSLIDSCIDLLSYSKTIKVKRCFKFY